MFCVCVGVVWCSELYFGVVLGYSGYLGCSGNLSYLGCMDYN